MSGQTKNHTKISLLTTFAENPEGIHFETQKKEEEVVLFLRPHLATNLPWILMVVLMVLIPGIILPVAWRYLALSVVFPRAYLLVGTLFWYLATFGFALASFLRWFFNIYIVTNERVVDIDFYYLLYKHVAEARLDNIQDISYRTSGIFSTLFNCGDVLIQTASETPNFEFGFVPQPEKVVETISELSHKHH